MCLSCNRFRKCEGRLKFHELVWCRVRHIVYSCVPRGDAKTVRLRAAVKAAGGIWRDVAALSESDLAHLARADGVDILVDLTGHTANNRLGTFAMRAAPLQVSPHRHPPSPCLKTCSVTTHQHRAILSDMHTCRFFTW